MLYILINEKELFVLFIGNKYKGDVMTDQKKNKTRINTWKISAIVLIFTTISVLGIFAYSISRFETFKRNSESLSVEMLNKLGQKQNEIDDLKSQINEIKDQDDVLRRDIELYIKTTHPKVSSIVAHEIAKQTVNKSRQHKIAPELVLGIMKVESAFNPMAVGPKTKYGHARGLMQVMPEWAPKLGLKNQYDFHEIHIAIESGIKVFLIHLEEGKGDISTGLYYYVNKDKAYVAKVYAAMGKFVAFRSTINDDVLNVETEIDRNGDSKKLPEDKKEPVK